MTAGWLLAALLVCLAGVYLSDRCDWLARLLHSDAASAPASETATLRRAVSVDGRSFGADAAALAQLLSCLATKDGSDGEALCGRFQRRGDDEVWAAAAGQPLVVRRLAAAINASRQLPEWSFDGFLGGVGELQRVCTGVRSDDGQLLPFFYFDKRRALYQQVPLARSRWRAPYNVVPSMSSAEFLRRDDVYYSSPLESVRGLDAATVERLLDMHPFARQPDTNRALWAGAAGVVSRLHYDAADNFYLQLSGRKTFHLLPPRHHWAVSVYPFVHPASRQSQFPLERLLSSTGDETRLDFDPDWLDAEHPLMRRAVNDLLVVTLQPGDLLFIPSFWLHHVTAVTASLSLSVFVRDYEKQLVADIFAAPPPHLGPYSDLPDRHQEALLFQLVADLLDAAAVLSRRPSTAAAAADDDDEVEPCDPRSDYCFLDKQGWLKALVYSRWRLLPVDPMLGAAAAQLTHSRSDFACGDAAAVESAPHLARSELANFAAATARHFRRLVRPVRHIVLGDYIETLVSNVVPIADVHAYLVHCANVGFST